MEDVVSTKGILKHLGIIKNELLIFTILVCLITNGFALTLTRSQVQLVQYSGLFMHFSTLPMIFGFGWFYVYALLKLPSSAQEAVFAVDARKSIKDHKNAL